MPTLRHQDWMTLHEVTLDLHAVRNLAALPSCIVEGVSRLIPCDTSTLQDDRGGLREIPWLQGDDAVWEPRPGGETGVRFMADWAVRFETLRDAYFAVSADRHPHAEHYQRTGDCAARRLSELVPMRTLEQQRFFQEISRPLSIRWQLGFYEPLPGGATLMLAVCRGGSDFSERDQTIMDLLRPHAAGAWRRAWQRERQRVQSLPCLAETVPSDDVADRETLRRALGLTPREAELLLWLGRGKTNAEISLILGISLSTVKTHFERIFVKLNCENRTAAALTASETLTR